MFLSLPSLIRDNPEQNEWCVPTQGFHGVAEIILDVHFLGMTALNDVGINHEFE